MTISNQDTLLLVRRCYSIWIGWLKSWRWPLIYYFLGALRRYGRSSCIQCNTQTTTPLGVYCVEKSHTQRHLCLMSPPNENQQKYEYSRRISTHDYAAKMRQTSTLSRSVWTPPILHPAPHQSTMSLTHLVQQVRRLFQDL